MPDMNEPLICFDLDGTLLDPDEHIHPCDRHVLLEERSDVILIPATGRCLQSLHGSLALNGLFIDQRLPFPLVLQNGSLLFDVHEKMLVYFPFPTTIQSEILSRADRLPQITFFCFTSQAIHKLNPTPFADQRADDFVMITQPYQGDPEAHEYSKIMCISDDQNALRVMSELLTDLPVECSTSLPEILEITYRGIDKAFGLQTLVDWLGLENRKIYMAGDGGNDLPLFELAELSFAPSSSPEFVRTRADRVIDRDRNGILSPIIEYALQQEV
jgi:Cof subfamily protein (haloacid dehalogenase superfamily)